MATEAPKTKLFVSSLPFTASESDVADHFRTHGKVVDVGIPIDKETGGSRGFGFVTMASAEDATAALDLDDSLLQGRRIRVRFCEPKTTQSRRA